MTVNTNVPRLALFFDKQREIIEAAETPFAKLAIFILPILAPVVPASLTGLHLYKLFLEIFSFQYADRIATLLACIVALVLEMLGYVGAISFIQAVFRLVKTRNTLYILPAVLNGLAYAFYLLLMFLVNYMLGRYFQTPDIINTIVGLLSFVTVPTGLLAANYLSQKEIKEDEKEIRKESREERLEKARIRAGKLSGNLPDSPRIYQKVSSNLPRPEETFQKLSSDWRKVSTQLSRKQIQFIADHEPKDIVIEFMNSGLEISPRTASNWRTYAIEWLQEN
jgi:hypothetical protein